MPLNINLRGKELRWLVKVGMFSQSECLLKNTSAVSSMKIQWGHGSLAPFADAHDNSRPTSEPDSAVSAFKASSATL